MAYYYKTGYLYNIIPLDNSIYLINIIIKEKRWNEMQNTEVINAVFSLIFNKYGLFIYTPGNPINNFNLILLQFFSLWSLISLLKIINLLSTISVFVSLLILYIYLLKFNLKNILTGLLIYSLITSDTNSLVISIVIIISSTIYYFLGEFYFFIFNSSNIKKVIKMYELPSKQAIISKVKDEYIMI